MDGILLALALLLSASLAPVVLAARPRAGLRAGLSLAVLACLVGAASAGAACATGARDSWRHAWSVPLGEIHVALDPLSSFFLTVLFVLGAATALYGLGYLAPYVGKRRLLGQASLLPLLFAVIAVLFLAADTILFLAAWEAMTCLACLLILFESEKPEVRRAAVLYLVMNHVAAGALVAALLLLGSAHATTDMARIATLAGAALPAAGLVFSLALVGFLTKAGVMPFHVWLPHAHPAAPSHLSAFLSGLLLKTGVYGLLRFVPLLGPPPAAFGAILTTVGLVSGVLGVVYALAQHEIKRLLAYHSVENLGIILMGAGVGMLGLSAGVPLAAAAGFAGALLHVANHALFKGCLFFGAGAVRHAAGTGNLDRLGGLARRMPTTSGTFLVSSAAISGLPPLNGFVSEFLVASGGLALATGSHGLAAALGLATVAGLGLIGGLACLCFAKAFGTVFLGRARSPEAEHAHEASGPERAAMLATAGLCVVIGLCAPLAIRFVAPAADLLASGSGTGGASAAAAATLDGLGVALSSVTAVSAAVLATAVALLLIRRALLLGRDVRRGPTWGCGFQAPTARMQYTASSFAAPTIGLFDAVLRTKVHGEPPAALHPAPATRSTHTGDAVEERLLDPFLARLRRVLDAFRALQHGSLHRYLLYMLLTLTALLLWTIFA